MRSKAENPAVALVLASYRRIAPAPGPASNRPASPASDSAPNTASDSAPNTASDSAPDPASDSAPGTASDSAPDPALDSAPATVSDSAPASTLDSASATTPDSAPGPDFVSAPVLASSSVSYQSTASCSPPSSVAYQTTAPGPPLSSVAYQTVAPGSIRYRTTAPCPPSGSVAYRAMAPGSVAYRTMAPGTVAYRTMAPDSVACRTMAPGSVAYRTMAPDSVAYRTMAPGSVACRTMAPGTVAYRTMAPDSVTYGTMAPGSVAYRTMAPGSVAYRTTAPGSVVYRTAAPDSVPGSAPGPALCRGTSPGSVAYRVVAPGSPAYRATAPNSGPCRAVAPGSVSYRVVAPGSASGQAIAPGSTIYPVLAPGSASRLVPYGTVTIDAATGRILALRPAPTAALPPNIAVASNPDLPSTLTSSPMQTEPFTSEPPSASNLANPKDESPVESPVSDSDLDPDFNPDLASPPDTDSNPDSEPTKAKSKAKGKSSTSTPSKTKARAPPSDPNPNPNPDPDPGSAKSKSKSKKKKAKGKASASDPASAKANATDPSRKYYQHKPHFCIFCKVEVSRIHTHFIRKHAKEDKVREVMATEDKRERYWRWKQLTQQGDNYFNSQKSDKTEKGRIVKAPIGFSRRKKYFDCENCMGRLRTASRSQHMKVCTSILLKAPKKVLEPLVEEEDVFKGLPEELLNYINKSLYLNSFVLHMLQVKENKQIVRTMITDLITLEEEIQKVTDMKKPLTSFLKTKHVDDIILAIKRLSGDSKIENEKVVKYPFRAQRLCRVVTHVSKFLIPYFSKRNLDRDVMEVTKFHTIFSEDAHTFIKKPVYRAIKLKNLKNPKQLPKTSDIVTLVEKLKNETTDLVTKLVVKKSPIAWRNLAENMLCRLTIFNRRRGGAIEKMTVADYTSTEVKSKVATEEAMFNLTKDDKEYLDNVRIVEIIHKCDNVVPIFINKEQQNVMDVLLKHRDCAGINKANNYFFAAGKNSLHPISGVRVMEKYRKVFPEETRHLFTATNLRKHGATTAQVLNLSHQEKEEWAYHMGHSLAVHDRYYRGREQVNGVLKTGRILTALDEGILKYYKGKKIQDIPFKVPKDKKEKHRKEKRSSQSKQDKESRTPTKEQTPCTSADLDPSDISFDVSRTSTEFATPNTTGDFDRSDLSFNATKTSTELATASTSADFDSLDVSLADAQFNSTPTHVKPKKKPKEFSSVPARTKRIRFLDECINETPKLKRLPKGPLRHSTPIPVEKTKKQTKAAKRNLTADFSDDEGGKSDSSGEWFTPGHILKSGAQIPTEKFPEAPKIKRRKIRHDSGSSG